MTAHIDDLNKVTLIGVIDQNPEVKHHPIAGPVTRFILVTAETRLKITGGTGIETVKHRVVIMGELAEQCSDYLKEGNRICVEGRNKTRFNEHCDGNKIFVTEVIADHMEMVD